MEKMKLSPPWITFVHEVEALFGEDMDISIKYDQEANVLKLFVEDPYKADALAQLLPSEKVYGNVTMSIEVVPSNKEATKADLIERAFSGNPALKYVYKAETPFGEIEYAVFRPKIIQFFNDQMDDINGNRTTLYQDIARDVFGTETGVFFCTDATAPNVEKPLGEWP